MRHPAELLPGWRIRGMQPRPRVAYGRAARGQRDSLAPRQGASRLHGRDGGNGSSMTEPQTEPRVQRQRLGAELLRLRVLAGMTGREVERLAGISHPRLSRIENGEIAATLPQLRASARVVRTKGDTLTRLLRRTEAHVVEVT